VILWPFVFLLMIFMNLLSLAKKHIDIGVAVKTIVVIL